MEYCLVKLRGINPGVILYGGIMAKLKTYTIGAHVHAWCETIIHAESLEHAAVLAQKLDLPDFVTFTAGACNDGSVEVIQIYDTDAEL